MWSALKDLTTAGNKLQLLCDYDGVLSDFQHVAMRLLECSGGLLTGRKAHPQVCITFVYQNGAGSHARQNVRYDLLEFFTIPVVSHVTLWEDQVVVCCRLTNYVIRFYAPIGS